MMSASRKSSCNGGASPQQQIRRKAKKFAEFNADAMTLNVFRENTRRENCLMPCNLLSSNNVYADAPGK